MFPFSISRSSKTSFPLLDEAAEHFTTPNVAGALRPSTLETGVAFLFKRSAKHLRTHLARAHGLELSHGQALDAVSAGLGCADWNTANAHLQRLGREDQGGLGLASAQAAAVEQVQGPWRHGHLRGQLDFNVSSAVVGAAGTGKSVGLLFALQSRMDALVGRPVMVVHGYESERYQPNWPGLLRHLPNMRAWSAEATTDSQTAVPAVTDAVEVTLSANALARNAAECDVEQRDLVAKTLQWLTARAHLRPLLLVDEAYELFGKHTEQFLAALPQEVVVIWVTQTIGDLGLPQLATRFDVVHLLSAQRGERFWEALGMVDEQARILARLRGLTLGQALTLPMRKVDRREAAKPMSLNEGALSVPDQALHQRVLAAIQVALPQMRLQREHLPNHILPVSAWLHGKQLHVLAVKLRDKVLQQLSLEDQAVVARMRRAGAPVSGLTLVMLDALDGAGWLVRQVGATTLAPTEALWNICVGKLNYKGVLVLELPDATDREDAGTTAVVPVVTGPLFAEQGEASKRVRSAVMGEGHTAFRRLKD